MKIGDRFFKKGLFNDECMGLNQTKAILGLFSIFIVLHHIAQKPASFDLAFFAPFRYSGYLFVSFFFFCSGYGLYKSFSSKQDYLKGFFGKRFLPLLITFFITDIIFQMARSSRVYSTFPANPYSWFVFVIMVLYAAFYFCFKLVKKNQPLVLLCCVIAGIIICALLTMETYIYNSMLAFPVGILFAQKQEKLTESIKKRYVPFLIISIIVSAVLIFFAAQDLRLYKIACRFYSPEAIDYLVIKNIQTVLQIFSSLAFCVFIVLLSMKICLENKVLNFFGSMTLEIYLVHVLFVELFTEKFTGSGKPLYYIQNQLLYTLVVLALTIPLAFLIKLVRSKVPPLVIGKPFTLHAVKVLKKTFLIFVVIGVIALVYYCITSHITTNKMRDKVKEYQNSFVTLTDIGGKKMASYKTGEGELTVILLGDTEDPAPTMTMRQLAEEFGKDYTVIVPDYLGQGFSDNADKPRTIENIAFELNSLLNALGYTDDSDNTDEKPLAILSIGSSGLYAQELVASYRKNVKAIVGFDMITQGILNDYCERSNFTPQQMSCVAKMNAKRDANFYHFMNLTGFVRMDLLIYDQAVYTHALTGYFDVVAEMLIAKRGTKESIDSQDRAFRELNKKDLSAVFKQTPTCLLTTDEDYPEVYRKEMTETDKQTIVKMTGGRMLVYYNTQPLAEQFKNFIMSI